MPRLLSGSTLRRGGSGEFLDLKGAMPQLPESPSQSTGFSLVTNNKLQTRYASSLGNIEFNQSSVYSSLPDGIIRVLHTGTTFDALSTTTATLVVSGSIGIGRNLWVEEDINVNGLIIGKGYEGLNNIVIKGTALPQEDDFLNGQQNIIVGYDALKYIETGYKNIAIGRYSLNSGTNLANSIAIGDSALKNVGSTVTSLISVITNKTVNPGISISLIAQENPVRIITAGHGLTTGEKVYIDGVNGFTVNGDSILNEKTFWIDTISLTELHLYKNNELTLSLDGTTATSYTSSGTIHTPVLITTSATYSFSTGDKVEILSSDEIGTFFAEPVSSTTFKIYYDNNLSLPVKDDIAITTGSRVSRVLDRRNNIGIGIDSGKNLIDGSQNLFIGFRSAIGLSTGSNNIIIGHETGRFVTSGSGIISIGGDNIVNGVNNQVNIGSVFYYDGQGNADLNTDVTLGLGSDSTSTETGALVVVGGIGLAGSLFVGGKLNVQNTSTFYGDILPSGPNVNIGSPTNRFANLYLDGTTLYLNTVTLKSYNSLDFTIESADGPVTQTVGNLLLNSGTTSTNFYTGALVVTGGVGISADTHMAGSLTVNGSGGVILRPSGADIEIVPESGGNLVIYPDGLISTMDNVAIGSIMPANGTFNNLTSVDHTVTTTTNATSTTTGALKVAGGVGIRGDVWVGGRLNSESVKIADAVFDSTLVTTSSTSSILVDQYPISQFRSAKYLIQIDEGSGLSANFQSIELLLLASNTGTVYATEYGAITSNGDLGDFTAGVFNITGSDTVQLYFSPYNATNKTIKVLRTGISS